MSATLSEPASSPGARPQVAVITGASQGLGRAVAQRLVAAGWAVVLDARRADRLDTAAAALATPDRVVALAGDITDAAHRRAIVAAATGLGDVAAVINNASTLGASPLPKLVDAPVEVLRRTFDVNVIAPLALIQELRPFLAAGATVVNITSDAGTEAYPTWGVYGASKAALEHSSRVLAEEEPDLHVLVVDPGDMRTEMHQDAFPGEDISDRPEPQASAAAIVALIDAHAPSGRYMAREVEVEVEAEAVQS
jgi:NAD(P)-dependent dehydrogenase (short-subunit alcohol dehydrogenase family)